MDDVKKYIKQMIEGVDGVVSVEAETVIHVKITLDSRYKYRHILGSRDKDIQQEIDEIKSNIHKKFKDININFSIEFD